MLRYLPKNFKFPSLLVEHEFFPAYFIQKSKFQKNPVSKVILWLRALRKFWQCRSWYKKAKKIVVFTEEDKSALSKLCRSSKVEVIPLGINFNDYPWQNAKGEKYDLIFVGNFSHAPNVDAVIYFYKNILPLVKIKYPNISVVFAGGNLALLIVFKILVETFISGIEILGLQKIEVL